MVANAGTKGQTRQDQRTRVLTNIAHTKKANINFQKAGQFV